MCKKILILLLICSTSSIYSMNWMLEENTAKKDESTRERLKRTVSRKKIERAQSVPVVSSDRETIPVPQRHSEQSLIKPTTEPHVTFQEPPSITIVQADTHPLEEFVEKDTHRKKNLFQALGSVSLKRLSRSKSAPSQPSTPIQESIPLPQEEKSMLLQLSQLTLQPKGRKETPELILIVQDEDLQALDEILYKGLSAVEINAQDEEKNTALMWTINKQDIYMTNLLLLQPYIDLNCQNTSGQTSLHFAVISKYVEIVQLLLSNQNLHVNKHDKDGHSPLHYAILMFLKNPEDFKALSIINTLLKDPRVSTYYYDNNKKEYMHNLIPKDHSAGKLHIDMFRRFMIEHIVNNVIERHIRKSRQNIQTDIIVPTPDDFDEEIVEQVITMITQDSGNIPPYAQGNLMRDFITKMIIARLNGSK